MVNHVRNLLMNVSRGGYTRFYPGEEYLPATYKPKKLSKPLQTVHRLLFGSQPDRLFRNYRMRQLMMLLHSTELEEYVYTFDDRVTYLPFQERDFFADVFGLTITQLGGNGDRLYIRGEHVANTTLGQVEQLWDVLVVSPTLVRVDKRRPPFDVTEYAVDFSRGLSPPIALAGSKLTMQFHPATTGTRWQIQSYGRPQGDLGELLPNIVTSFGERGDQEVFPPLSDEPIRTFERVWRQHPLAPYRYSALMLAMAWKINSLAQDT